MSSKTAVLVLAVLAVFVFAGYETFINKDSIIDTGSKSGESRKTFSSCDAMHASFKAAQESQQPGALERLMGIVTVAPSLGVMKSSVVAEGSSADASSDYSKTNVQVEGVDEADIVKTDGEFIYIISNQKLIIAKAYPAEEAAVLSETKLDFYPSEMFIEGSRLLVFGLANYDYYASAQEKTGSYRPIRSSLTKVELYDTTNKEGVELVKSWEFEGSYISSRKIDNYVYFALNSYVYLEEEENILPQYREGGNDSFAPITSCTDVVYFDPVPAQNFITLVGMSMLDESAISKEVIAGSGQNIYSSADNFYIAQSYYDYPVRILRTGSNADEKTAVQKFSLDNGKVSFVAGGEVPGSILNQFSMDEHEGNFRIATTKGDVWSGNSTSNVYVLDEELKLIGVLEGLAPGERIYSSRFMGDRAYLVTFKKVDPLFVIDLSDPENPEVLGKLKIPGYSDYLHPYDENHIIGIGKEAVDAEESLVESRGLDFAWYQGVKMAVFDVSDVENPKELHKVVIGDRGTDSAALQDHKAFLFDKEKNLLVVPVLLAEIKDKETASANTYGDYVFQGAYVYDLTLDNGFNLKGRITHFESEDAFKKSGHYFYGSDYSIIRSLYIDDTLYTLSSSVLKLNNLDTLEELKALNLS